MKAKEKRTKATTKQQQNQNQKETKAKKLHIIWQHKSGANILTKLIRLMEVFRRHA